MAANFADPDKHESPDISLAQEEIIDPNHEHLSKRQRENKEKYKDSYRSLRHRFPGGMNKYERYWYYQLGMYLLLLGLAILNLLLNFRMIDVYEDLLRQLDALPNNAGFLDPNDVNRTALEFAALDDVDGLCDIEHFVNEFEKQELENSVLNVQRFIKAATYITVGFGFWVTFIIKAMSHYNLCTEDFAVIATETLEQKRRESMENPEAHENTPKKSLGEVIKVAGGKVKNQETIGEKKIRTYLRSDTVLFGLNQVFQDIPMATASVLYLLFLLRERGILCYESFTQNIVSETFSLDEADPIVFAQIGIIVLNVFVHFVANLAPRWIAFFNHQTVKHALTPRSTTVRVFNVGASVLGYLLAILLPLFVTLYTPIGTELLGLNTTGSEIILVLIVFSSICLSLGTFLICCHWGAKFSEGFFIFSTLTAAFELGCEGCFEIEVCELCECCC